MKRRIAAALAALILLFQGVQALALTAEDTAPADRYFAGMFDRAQVVGGAVLVSQRGERIYSFFWGGRDKTGRHPVTEDAVFKVASVTKMIAAVGVMQLAEEGKLDLDAPLCSAEGLPIRNPRWPDRDVTLRQALSHTTSFLPSAPYAGALRWDRIDETDSTFFSDDAPGTRYAYANLNGGILCSEIERASGQNFNDYMAAHVFAPLGINASFAAHLLPDPDFLANTYTPQGLVYQSAERYIETDAAEYDGACDPAGHYRASVGGLYISLSGLEKIGVALAGDGSVDGVRLLTPGSVRLMRRDQRQVPGSTVSASSPYGLGVCRVEIGGRTWYGHQGRWEGLLADLFWEPESETVVVFVMNGLAVSFSGKEIATRPERAINYISRWIRDAESSFIVVDEKW